MINRVDINDFLVSVTEMLDGSHIRKEGFILVRGSERRGIGVELPPVSRSSSDMLYLGGSRYREVWLEPEAEITFKDGSPLPGARLRLLVGL